MKYSEAEKQIKALSSKYNINTVDGYFIINYKFMLVAWVKNDKRYLFYNDENIFKKLPFSNKLYMILAELAITPLDERAEKEKKYYIHVLKGENGYLNISISNGNITIDSLYETHILKTKFTNKAIEQLKQRDDIPLDWNKVILEQAE